jgi:hypothetical protein
MGFGLMNGFIDHLYTWELPACVVCYPMGFGGLVWPGKGAGLEHCL